MLPTNPAGKIPFILNSIVNLPPIRNPGASNSQLPSISQIMQGNIWNGQPEPSVSMPPQTVVIPDSQPDTDLTFAEAALVEAIMEGEVNDVLQLIQLNPSISLKKVERHLPHSHTLWGACALGNTALIESLLKAGFNPRAQKNGSSPLAIAIRARHYTSVRVLVDHLEADESFCLWSFVGKSGLEAEAKSLFHAGFEVSPKRLHNCPDALGLVLVRAISESLSMSPLEYVAIWDLWKFIPVFEKEISEPLVIQLMRSPFRSRMRHMFENPAVNIHLTGPDGVTALQLAVRNDDVALVQVLIERGAMISVCDAYSDSVFSDVEDKSLEISQILENADTLPEPELIKLAKESATGENRWGVIYVSVLQGHVSPNCSDKRGNTLLHYAVRQKQFEVVERLIAAGANIHGTNINGMSPLSSAIVNGDVSMLDLLVAHGATLEKWPARVNLAKITCDMYERVFTILGKCQPSVILKAYKSMINPLAKAWDPVYASTLAKLFAAVPPPSEVTSEQSIQHIFAQAVKHESVSLVKACVPYLKNRTDALADAIRAKCCVELAECIIDAGVDLNHVPEDSLPLLEMAILNPELLALLLRRGANPNILNRQQYSPLSVAMYADLQVAVSYLLAAGANPNFGRTVWQEPVGLLARALELGWGEICDQLITAGASTHGLDLSLPRSLMAQFCYLQLEKYYDSLEGGLRQQFGEHFLDAEEMLPERIHSNEYFLKRTGPIEFRIYFADFHGVVSGNIETIQNTVEKERFSKVLRWLNTEEIGGLIIVKLYGVSGSRLDEKNLDGAALVTDWNNPHVVIQPDHELNQFHLYWSNPVDLSVVKRTLDLEAVRTLSEQVGEIRESMKKQALELQAAARAMVVEPFRLEICATGYKLILKDESKDYEVLLTGFGLKPIQKGMISLKNFQEVTIKTDEHRTLLENCEVTANESWTELNLSRPLVAGTSQFQLVGVPWDELMEGMAEAPRLFELFKEVAFQTKRFGDQRLITTEPLPQPNPNTRLDWLEHELRRLRGTVTRGSHSWAHLESGMKKFLTLAKNGKGALGIADEHESIYARFKQLALLTIEELKKSQDSDKRASTVTEIALAGHLCGLGMKDAVKEQYEVTSGNFQLIVPNESLEAFENSIIELCLREIEVELLKKVTDPEARAHTPDVKNFITRVFNERFNVAFGPDQDAAFIDPFCISFGILAFAQQRPYNFKDVLGRLDSDPAKRQLIKDAVNHVYTEISKMFWPTLLEIYTRKLNEELATGTGKLSMLVRARSFDFAEAHLISDEDAAQLREMREKYIEEQLKKSEHLTALRKTMAILKDMDVIKQCESIQKDLHALEKLGPCVKSLRKQLNAELNELTQKKAYKRYLEQEKLVLKQEKLLKKFNEKFSKEYDTARDDLCSDKCDPLQLITTDDQFRFQLSPQGILVMLYQGGFIKEDEEV